MTGTLETNERFPSGDWHGFFLQPQIYSSRVKMALFMSFRQDMLDGSGQDVVGEFFIRGKYELESGEVTFHKRYIGQHDVYYKGFADGTNRGIWGTWEMGDWDRGGFHIWPKGQGGDEALAVEEHVYQPNERVVLVGVLRNGTRCLVCNRSL